MGKSEKECGREGLWAFERKHLEELPPEHTHRLHVATIFEPGLKWGSTIHDDDVKFPHIQPLLSLILYRLMVLNLEGFG